MLLPGGEDEVLRPGASLRAAARRSRTLLLAIGAAIILLLGCGVWAAVGGSSPPSAQSGSSPASAGPRGVVDGVPVGYARSQAGAVAAAVNYELARSRPQYIADEAVRHRVLRQIMTASALPAQLASDDTNSAPTAKALGLTPGGLGPGGATWMVHSAPLGVQVAAYSGYAATVNVWMAEIAGVVGDPNTPLPPTGSYTTYVLALAWQNGDWRIESIGTRSGPVPVASTNQSPTAPQQWQQSGRFNPPPPVS